MFISLVFLVMMSTGTFIIVTLRMSEETARAGDLEGRALDIYSTVIEAAFNMPDFDPSDGRDALEALFTQSFSELVSNRIPEGIQAFIISGENFMTLETNADRSTDFYNFMTQQVIITALQGNTDFSAWRSYLDHLGNSYAWFEFAMPVFLDGMTGSDFPDYVIYIRSSAETFNASLRRITQTIGLVSIFALVASSVLSVIFAGSLTQNLLRLNKKIKEFKVGAGANPLTVTAKIANDEIGQLAVSFNNMEENLERGMATLTNEKNKMEIIMYNMSDGVLAYDEGGVLIHSNYACEELLGMENIVSMSMAELFAKIDIDLPEDGSIENMEDAIINIGEKYINTGFNPYKDHSGRILGVIIVFQDITKHMLLDNMRKEFVANVSHEIRTPLTTIKSYTETLLDGAAESEDLRNEFLSVINSEADRMAAIVKDLLELSRFDSKRMEFDYKFTDLAELVSSNVRQHKVSADKLGKEINFTSHVISAHIHVDPERINQVLNNIITNSFRYSGDNAKIDVDIHESGRFYMVYITDNGIGIPREDLRRVFERFYRVDKARSRELGGTGLGLSIAKEIMEAHGGRINVSSELGEGTTMMLRFPKEFS